MKIGHGICQLVWSSEAALFSDRRHLQVALGKVIVGAIHLFQWYECVPSYSSIITQGGIMNGPGISAAL